MVAWLGLRVLAYTFVQQPGDLAYETSFGRIESRATAIKDVTCNRPDALLAFYPRGVYYYWFTDLKPVSKYLFMYPWVAEVGLRDVLDVLQEKDVPALVVIRDDEVWSEGTRDYLSPLYEYLGQAYVPLAEDAFLSPQLASFCQQ
jgi:hypothetical protein